MEVGTEIGKSLFTVSPFCMQLIFIIRGFHIFEFAYLLKFITPTSILIFMVVHRHAEYQEIRVS